MTLKCSKYPNMLIQYSDWPPGYVPNSSGAPGPAAAGGSDFATTLPVSTVPLNKLQPQPQLVDCPNCKQQAETVVQGRSKGKQRFMNIFWWPLPNRKHWWEKIHWYCKNCEVELAMQKEGHPLEVLVKAN